MMFSFRVKAQGRRPHRKLNGDDRTSTLSFFLGAKARLLEHLDKTGVEAKGRQIVLLHKGEVRSRSVRTPAPAACIDPDKAMKRVVENYIGEVGRDEGKQKKIFLPYHSLFINCYDVFFKFTACRACSFFYG
ncbi:hypothetical protein [Paenibacillus flagellatus]|uniref:hypothetical protein n=1 Tax=Paenibacillus flagellatus TaxID=2211139 RepID=UPI00147370EA|nr:hypothetical protein [Paenibacillus flagellatus]